MNKTFAIGDIHGGLKALKQVLERASVSVNDRLIFLGDYVDGWSESAQAVDFLIELSKTQSCIFLQGNHDVWCEEWLRSNVANESWLKHGGKETIESYANTDQENKTKHLQFFEQLKFWHIENENKLFIHAGYTSSLASESEIFFFDYNWDRSLWEEAMHMDRKVKKKSSLLPSRLRPYEEIYIGHTPTLYFKETVPMNACNVWNLDTGAAFYGKLSIMDINTKQFWQSDVVKDLYPGEIGRNKD